MVTNYSQSLVMTQFSFHQKKVYFYKKQYENDKGF